MSVRALMPVWRFAANSLLQMVDEELVYLANNLLDILLDKICLDMCSAWNDKESLVCRARCLGKSLFRHIPAVCLFACNHKQRLADEVSMVGSVLCHHIPQRTFQVTAWRIRCTVCNGIIETALAIKVYLYFARLLWRHICKAQYFGLFACSLFLSCQ